MHVSEVKGRIPNEQCVKCFIYICIYSCIFLYSIFIKMFRFPTLLASVSGSGVFLSKEGNNVQLLQPVQHSQYSDQSSDWTS